MIDLVYVCLLLLGCKLQDGRDFCSTSLPALAPGPGRRLGLWYEFNEYLFSKVFFLVLLADEYFLQVLYFYFSEVSRKMGGTHGCWSDMLSRKFQSVVHNVWGIMNPFNIIVKLKRTYRSTLTPTLYVQSTKTLNFTWRTRALRTFLRWPQRSGRGDFSFHYILCILQCCI